MSSESQQNKDKATLMPEYFASLLASPITATILAAAQAREVSAENIFHEFNVPVTSAFKDIKKLWLHEFLQFTERRRINRQHSARFYRAAELFRLTFSAETRSLEFIINDVVRGKQALCAPAAPTINRQVDRNTVKAPEVILNQDNLGNLYQKHALLALAAAVYSAKSSKEVSQETGIPLASSHKVLKNLRRHGLMVAVDSVLSREGKRFYVYLSNVRRVEAEISKGKYVTTVYLFHGQPITINYDFSRRLKYVEPEPQQDGSVEEGFDEIAPHATLQKESGRLASVITSGLELLVESLDE